MNTPAQAWLQRFNVSAPVLLARTGIATVWRVHREDGSEAALKLYDGGNEKDEAPGLDLLTAWQGTGAAQLYDRAPGAVLMEYLPGPSLGAVARNGDDLGAARLLAKTMKTLRANPVGPNGLTPLAQRCRALFESAPCPPHLTQTMQDVQALARSMLVQAVQPAALHGDLHHDNVLQGPRGWCAIDLKGLWGDPAYEPANAFRNPVHAPQLWRDPDRIRAMADIFADQMNLPVQRLLAWAAIHAMLSLLWDGALADHPDTDLPGLYLSLCRAV